LLQIMKYTSAVLPKEVERMMIDEFRENRPYLNELLFNHNARAATTLANKYYFKYTTSVVNPIYQYDDFLSEARYGLWQAAVRFDLDRTWQGVPVKFLTFATPWIFRYIMELFYRKENMISVQSLDASPYNDSEDGDDMTLAETISEEDSMQFQDAANASYEEEDIDNAAFEEGDKEDLSLVDIEGQKAGLPGFTFNDDVELTDDRRAKEYMEALKRLVKSGQNDLDKETIIEAVDDLCRTIAMIKDPEEKAITLFISKRYIQHAISKVGDMVTQPILNAKQMLKNVPGSRTQLLDSLHLNDETFAKLCNKYAAKYTRECV